MDTLGIEVDAGPLTAATAALDTLSTAASRLAQGLDPLARAGDNMATVLADLQRSGAANAQVVAELAQRYGVAGQAAQAAAAGTQALTQAQSQLGGTLQQAGTASQSLAQANGQMATAAQASSAALAQEAAAAQGLYGPLAQLAALQGRLTEINQQQAASSRGLFGNLGQIAGQQAATGGAPAADTAGTQQATAANAALARSAATATEAERELAAAAGGAGSAAASSSAGMGRLSAAAAEVAGSSRSLDAAFAQFEPLAAQQQRIVQALAAGYIGAETAAQAWVLAERGAAEASRGFGAGVGGGFASLGQRNFAITNASEQLRQFVEQISNGTPVVQAFSQQAPQALVGFGPWAAVLGVVAAAIGGLITLLPRLTGEQTNAAKAAKDQQQATDDLLKALDVSAEGVGRFQASLAGLTGQQRSLVGADLTADLHAQSAAFDEAAKKAGDYAKGLGTGAFSAVVSRIAPSEFAIPSSQDLEALKALGDASTDLQNRMQALQAGAGSFDAVADAIRRMADAQREGGDATAKQRVEVEQQIDKLAPLASAEEAARQSLLLHTAQVHEFLDAMGQKGAITAFDEQILNQAEVAKAATAALQQLNTAHRLVVASQVADRIRASDLPDAGKQADDYLTRETAKGPAEEFKTAQETRQAEATIVFKGDTTQATKALDLLKQAGTDVGETFDQTEQRLKELGGQLGTPFPVIQRAIAEARLEADKLIVSQRQAAVVQALVAAGFSPEKAQQQASAIAAGNQGLSTRAQTVAAITQAQQAEQALAARGPGFERERAAASQNVVQLQDKLRQIDEQQAQTARGKAAAAAAHADQLARQRDQLLAQEGPEARLLAAEQERARAARQGLLHGPDEVQQSLQGAYRTYADQVAQQAAQQAAGLSERERVQAQINAELAAEAAHGEARVAIDRKIVELRGQLAGIDAREQDALEKQNATIEAGIAKQESQLAQLRARGGGSTALAVQDARQAAVESVPQITPAQMDTPGGPAAFDDRAAAQRRKADLAEQIVLQQQYNSVVGQVRTPLQAYTDEVGKLDDLYGRGKLSADEYARAIVGIVTPQQQYGEEMARIAAQMVQVDRLYASGNITLARRNQLLLAGAAAAGAAAARERQGAIQQDLNVGEAGSGASGMQRAFAGLDAGAKQLQESYGNSSKMIAQGLTDAFSQGADALTTFLTTGKADFRGMITSILNDLTKLALEYTIIAAFRAAAGLGGAGAGGGAGELPTLTTIGGVYHQGGLVGEAGPSRLVSPMLFANAPRALGGIDLSSGEVPIIAHRGERVLNPAQTAAYNQGDQGRAVSVRATLDLAGIEDSVSRGVTRGTDPQRRSAAFPAPRPAWNAAPQAAAQPPGVAVPYRSTAPATGATPGTASAPISLHMPITVNAQGSSDPRGIQAASQQVADQAAAKVMSMLNRNPGARAKATGR